MGNASMPVFTPGMRTDEKIDAVAQYAYRLRQEVKYELEHQASKAVQEQTIEQRVRQGVAAEASSVPYAAGLPAYPPGSVYTCGAGYEPKNLFGGKWERIDAGGNAEVCLWMRTE